MLAPVTQVRDRTTCPGEHSCTPTAPLPGVLSPLLRTCPSVNQGDDAICIGTREGCLRDQKASCSIASQLGLKSPSHAPEGYLSQGLTLLSNAPSSKVGQLQS